MLDGVEVVAVSGLALCLASCQVQDQTAPASTDEATSPVSTEPGQAPVSHAPAVSTIQPTPNFPEAAVAHSLLLSEGTSADCQLPCWRGLRIDESSVSDVQRVFSEMFDTPADYDFFPLNQGQSAVLDNLLNVEGIFAGGVYWYVAYETGAGAYFLLAFMDEDTGTLTGIEEAMLPAQTYSVPSITEVTSQLGPPDWIYGSGTSPSYFVNLFYQEGIEVSLSYIIVPREPLATTARLCLNNEPDTVRVRLSNPYSDLENLTAFQQARGVPEHPAPYITEELGASIEEFMEFIHSDNPCREVRSQ